MDLEEANKICGEFTPVEKPDGTYGCQYIDPKKMCTLSTHFVCELVLESDLRKRAAEGKKSNEPTRGTVKKKMSQTALPIAEKPVEQKLTAKNPLAAAVAEVEAEKEAKATLFEPSKIALVRNTKFRLPIVSVSRLGILEQCPRLYMLRYTFKVKPPFDQAWKKNGIAFTEARALIDEGKPWKVSGYGLSQVEEAKLRAVLRQYEKRRTGELLKTETKVSFRYEGLEFVGFIDSESQDGKELHEWKYAATKYTPIKVARQVAVYMHGKPKAEKMILAVAPKLQHKPLSGGKPTKKNPEPQEETIAEFEERLFNLLEEEDRFEKTTFKRGHFDIDAILSGMTSSFSMLPEWAERNFPPHYSIHCEDCEFYELCNSHLDRDIGCMKNLCATKPICNQIKQARSDVVDMITGGKR
jgi:hypothetical protein